MLEIVFLALNNKKTFQQFKKKLLSSFIWQIMFLIFCYCFLVNIFSLCLLLFIKIEMYYFITFNFSVIVNLICFLALVQASKWLFTNILFKIICGYLLLFLRLLLYSCIILLVIAFDLANIFSIFSIIIGYLSSTIAIIVSQFRYFSIKIV